ncbi:29237_t:CDS:2 [Gigaspora margarita]|uniref:29237_t:CDS:1 n=1 Tax=Gigaspora margarita TaxID=4874 RepID=A0ABN7V3A7_GIGMA|nr:29237_t:CDS:2 [Gigaspora margarita]
MPLALLEIDEAGAVNEPEELKLAVSVGFKVFAQASLLASLTKAS